LISGGKVNLPALGFGMGDVVLLELLKERKLLPKFGHRLDVFFLIEDEAVRLAALRLVQDLRQHFKVEYPLTPMKGDKQFKRALELNATCTAKLEPLADGTWSIHVKQLSTREEKSGPSVDTLLAWIRSASAPAVATSP
jgi:histidyl-tRNA synthetase